MTTSCNGNCACSCSAAAENAGTAKSVDAIAVVSGTGAPAAVTGAFAEAATTAAAVTADPVLRYYIDGLDCADCAAKVEKILSQQAGVRWVRIDFGAGALTLSPIEPAFSLPTITSVVSSLGYRLRLPEGAGGSRAAQETGTMAGKEPRWRRLNLRAARPVLSGLGLALGLLLDQTAATALSPLAYAFAIVAGGWPIARAAWTALKALTLDMNVLMLLAVAGAIAIQEWSEAAAVVFLFSLGAVLQASTLDKTRRSIRSLLSLTPAVATVSRNGVESTEPVEQIIPGDMIIVRPGDRIPLDGQVLRGVSSVNQAPVTGESTPVEKEPGDGVFAGTVNENGLLEILVTRPASDSAVARIIRLVEEAQSRRAPAQQFVDRFAAVYTPTVIVLAALVAVVPPLFGAPWEEWFYRALELLVVSCPCALVISTPVAIVAAIGNGAKQGVLIKGGAHLEELGRINTIAFDKTGTLTVGRPAVAHFLNVAPPDQHDDQALLSIAWRLERRSSHPLAAAIVRFAEERLPATAHGDLSELKGYATLPGAGVSAVIGGVPYALTSPGRSPVASALPENLLAQIDTWQRDGYTVSLLSDDRRPLALFALSDACRPESGRVLARLKAAGVSHIAMLTGDNSHTARRIAAELSIDEVHAELLPAEKAETVQALMRPERRVAMVGDGINDAPALTAAHLGVAMGGYGSDMAMETADVILASGRLEQLPFAIRLGRSALSIIRQNIIFALVVKAVALLLILPNWLNLWLAVLSDTGAALVVILNALRLLNINTLSPDRPR
ncbi:cadmium-translocating p-type ATPase [Heliomicrobium modesticaldum Ice1]|uniref:Cd(2+)-exporting ATPase n=1 Tax=Heliobacterium modesticaldum (strain ATCC 51547 / Ice1) TaxID=498761 RepID=B0TCD3_HELMI|nr:cation-translocating P-type ATPase [Heliomicrobium modesticaldum]ABZ85321.1 cadmium-translocating p-type ATPase [Heliomicrobium modesticaldum Ice1]